MRFLGLSLFLLLSACASAPTAPPEPARLPAAPAAGASLLGLTEAQLLARLGPAPFRLREGPGLKLQWEGPSCVLDAYLYPPERGSGAPTVLHVDTRRPLSGEGVAVEGCVAGLTR